MNTLHLTLKRQWFDMIQSGEKKEEYREIKPYWIGRLFDINPATNWEFEDLGQFMIETLAGYKPKSPFRQFTHTHFTNGYSKNSPSFTIECNGIRIGRGNPDWGAPTDRDVFILSLGKIIKQ